MRAKASACGSATVVNAIASGKGGAFALDLRVYAEVELREEPGIKGEIEGEPEESPKLIETCVAKVLEFLGLEGAYGARVRTTSEVPIAVGLSSSSAAANAVVLATFAALGKKPNPRRAINLGIDAAFEAGVTLTGAFDDASASYLGGGVLTDNTRRRILKRFTLDPELRVVVHAPPVRFHTSGLDPSWVKPIARFVNIAHRQAVRGNVLGALTLNGLLYSSALGYGEELTLEALRSGALAAGLTGTGPAVVAIAKPKKAKNIIKKWQRRPGRVILTKPSQVGARVEALG